MNANFTAAERKIIDALGRGESAARTQRELTAITGFDARTTRKVLESARKKGAVVCGADAGRYLPETLEELRRYVRRVSSQVENESIALNAAKSRLREWEKRYE